MDLLTNVTFRQIIQTCCCSHLNSQLFWMMFHCRQNKLLMKHNERQMKNHKKAKPTWEVQTFVSECNWMYPRFYATKYTTNSDNHHYFVMKNFLPYIISPLYCQSCCLHPPTYNIYMYINTNIPLPYIADCVPSWRPPTTSNLCKYTFCLDIPLLALCNR